MLVISRKVGERIMIAKDITLVVLEVSGTGRVVRLGIEAPPEIPIHRQELLARTGGRVLKVLPTKGGQDADRC